MLSMLPANYQIRHLDPSHYETIIAICRLVYPTETPYTVEELEDHRQVFPQGQFVAIEASRNEVAGVHFTLRLRMIDFHIDDSWDILTAGGSFLDHDPTGPTLYGADIMVHPCHQHHGIAHALTDQTRFLVQHTTYGDLWPSGLSGVHRYRRKDVTDGTTTTLLLSEVRSAKRHSTSEGLGHFPGPVPRCCRSICTTRNGIRIITNQNFFLH